MLAVRVAAVGAGPRAAAGQGQRNHPRQAAGRAFGRSRPSGRRSRAGRRQGQSGRLARRFRRCGDGVAPGSWRPAARGAGRHHAPAGRHVARLRGRAGEPTEWLAWRRSSPARSSRPSARAWRASCPAPMAGPRTRPVRMLREQYKVQVLPASADAIRASSARLGGLTPVEQGRSAGHTLSSSWGWASSLGWMPSAQHGPVRRNAFHQEGTSRAFSSLATVGNSCAKRCV